MFRKAVSLFLCLLMVLSLLPVSSFAAEEVKGDFMQKINQITWEDVIPEGYITISTEAELEAVQNNPSGFYILMEDIDIQSFDILCSNDDPFTGVFEGNGHTISGIEIDITGTAGSTYYWGLFSTIEDARIANLRVEGSLSMAVNTSNYKKGICHIGGLAGHASGDITVTNCVNAVSISVGNEDGFKDIATGGLIGYYSGSSGDSAAISSCRNLADINAMEYVGGIVGYCTTVSSDLSITNCRNAGSINTLDAVMGSGGRTGGIVGESYIRYSSVFDIYACMNTGKIDARLYAGGIIGSISYNSSSSNGHPTATISSCANTGEVYAKETAGGIVSSTGSGVTISDCINTGAVGVSSAQTECAGIAGTGPELIERCINTGKISSGSYKSAIECTVDATSQSQVAEMVVDCYWLSGSASTLYRKYFWGDSLLTVTDGMMTAEEMKVEENFKNYSFPAVWTMVEDMGHPFPTALLDISMDNTYQSTYIENTVSYSNDSYRYTTIMGGSGDGSLAGVVGDTYSQTLLDEVNGIWNGMQFVESIANYSIPTTTDYDVLLADLLGGTVSRNIREEHATASTLNFASEILTLCGAELDAMDVLATEKYLADMAELPTVFGDGAKTLLDTTRSTVLGDLPYEKFSGFVSNVASVVNISAAAAAGCDSVNDTYDFYILCNAYADTVASYRDAILNAAEEAKAIDSKEGGDLYKSASEFASTINSNLSYDPQSIFDAYGGSLANFTTVTSFTTLENVLKLKDLNPVLSVIDGIKAGITIGMPVADALTNMDKIAYYGRMIEMCNTMAKGLHAEILERRSAFLSTRSYKDAEALNFASSLYLNLQILACDYAIGYCNAIASSSMSNLFHLNQDDLVAIVQMQVFKADLLKLQKNGKNIYIGQDGSINGFVANCPVTVVVTDSKGNEISRMSTGSITTADGYGGSYMLLGSSGEHKAGLYDPNEHTVTIIGEGSGTMTLVDYGSKDGEITYVNTYRDVPIEEGTTYVITPSCLDGETDVYPVESGTEHTYTASVTAPTCVSQGYTTYTCPCGYSYVGDYTAATGVHTYSDSSDATCDICGFTRLVLPTAPAGAGYTPMYRLYNPYSGEHFYTGSTEETQNLYTAGWQYEGVAWNAPTRSGEPVYRLYNPNSGDHHYTMSLEEKDMLVGVGWQYEGVCWNSAPADKLPLYRLWNPNADCSSHHYTGSTEERDMLVSVGWIYEGIGWFGLP